MFGGALRELAGVIGAQILGLATRGEVGSRAQIGSTPFRTF